MFAAAFAAIFAAAFADHFAAIFAAAFADHFAAIFAAAKKTTLRAVKNVNENSFCRYFCRGKNDE